MKKMQWPMQLKKQFILLFHIVFLGLLLIGSSFIYLNSNYDKGLSWIHGESYANASAFKELLEDDIEKTFQYINYKDMFKTDGEVDYSGEMVSATFNSGKAMVYTLDALMWYAKGMGHHLDDSYEVAGGSKSPSMDEVVYPQINWKAHSPNEQYNEPEDAYASLEEFPMEVLALLSKYYRIRLNYVAKPSNLYFQVFYMSDNLQGSLYTDAAGRSSDESKRLSRYPYTSGETILMDTNMKCIPGNVTLLLEKYNFYNNNNYYIVIALDATCSYGDDYSKASHEYLSIRTDYITDLMLLGIDLMGCLIILAYLLPILGYETRRRDAVRLYGFDKLPLELDVVLFLPTLYLVSLLSGKVGYRFLYLMVDDHYWSFAKQLLSDILVYLCCLTEAFSLVRCYKAKVLQTNSLLHSLYQQIIHCLIGVSYPSRFALTFLGYLLVNGVLIAAFSYLFTKQDLLSSSLFHLMPAVTIICFNIRVLLGLLKNAVESEKISKALYNVSSSDAGYMANADVFTKRERQLTEAINNAGSGLGATLQEQVRSEWLKVGLITNIPHDIKALLTSIINYIDLIKRGKVQDERIQRYLKALDQKSQRLKALTEDLVEASKAGSNDLKLEIPDIGIVELVWQTSGEFREGFEIRRLEIIRHFPDEAIIIEADGRRLWWVLEDLYDNAFKCAMMNSRVYIDIFKEGNTVYFIIKDVSESPLNTRANELTKRFVQGGVARITEESGLGLSVTKNSAELQGGTFILYIDGDLFKAQVGLPIKVKA